jgi:hypothetical protein
MVPASDARGIGSRRKWHIRNVIGVQFDIRRNRVGRKKVRREARFKMHIPDKGPQQNARLHLLLAGHFSVFQDILIRFQSLFNAFLDQFKGVLTSHASLS